MPQRPPQTAERGQSPKKPQNAALRNLRRRIRAVQKSWNADRRLETSAPEAYEPSKIEQAPFNDASENTSAREDDVVLNFQNMDQDCALRPVTANPTIDTSHLLGKPENVLPPPGNRLPTPDTVTAGHTRLTIDERGQLRYFGYSSLMRVVSILPPSSPSNSATSAAGPETQDEVRGDMAMLADSVETQNHLLDLFFQYQHAALPIIDETAFRESHAHGKRTEYYSAFLLHSILLRAIKFSDPPHADKLKNIYLRRIRGELLFEIENPSIATIPALCVFGSYLAGEGSDRGCWLYPGKSPYSCPNAFLALRPTGSHLVLWM